MLQGAIEFFLGFHGAPAYGSVFALAMLEAAAFVGLLVPGELAVILGGVLASRGNVDFWWIAAAASSGAILGDSIGYWIGTRFGDRLIQGRVGRWIGPRRWTHARAAIARRGAVSVIIGRFTTALRVLVPGLAGMARMPYGRFFVANVIGGVAWAAAFTGLGYAAGSAWERAARVAGAAGAILFGLVVLALLLFFVARWIARHPTRFRQAGRWLGRQAPIRWVRRTFNRELKFLAARFSPHGALGLRLTIGAVAAATLGTVFGLLVARALSRVVPIDASLAQWLENHSVPWLSAAMRGISIGASPITVAACGLCATLVHHWRSRTWAAGSFLAIVCLGGEAMRWAVQLVVSVAADHEFPSGPTTRAIAMYGALAYVVGSMWPAWRLRVVAWTAALGIASLIGVSQLLLGRAYLTDVLGGLALGGLWLAMVLTVVPPTAVAGGERGSANERSDLGAAPRLRGPLLPGRDEAQLD